MQQFIRYLYEYKKGEKIRNIGFVKVEKKEEECTVHIHGKGVDFGSDKKMEVLIFYMKDNACVGISQGYIQDQVSTLHQILRFEIADAGSKEIFGDIRGIILQNGEGKWYAATWDDMAIIPENMKRPQEIEAEMPEAEIPEELEIEPECEIACEAEFAQEVEEYIPPKNRSYEKIQRQDLARLPRKEWRLANNSFLLHGFYNYHHLLYIEEDGNCWIGVPGIFHEKEQDVARAFGFPQFHRITEGDLELAPEETNTYEDFGYWCRTVQGRSS